LAEYCREIIMVISLVKLIFIEDLFSAVVVVVVDNISTNIIHISGEAHEVHERGC
jgi:hypothetical protein